MTFKNLLLALTLVSASTQSVFSMQENTGTAETAATVAAIATPVVAARFSLAGLRSAVNSINAYTERIGRKILDAPAQAANFVTQKAVAAKNIAVGCAKNAFAASKAAVAARAHQLATLVVQNKLKSAGIAAAVAGTIAAGYYARQAYLDYQFNKLDRRLDFGGTIAYKVTRKQYAAYIKNDAEYRKLHKEIKNPKPTLGQRIASTFRKIMYGSN